MLGTTQTRKVKNEQNEKRKKVDQNLRSHYPDQQAQVIAAHFTALCTTMHDTAGHNRRSTAAMEVVVRGKESVIENGRYQGDVVVVGVGRGAKQLGDSRLG